MKLEIVELVVKLDIEVILNDPSIQYGGVSPCAHVRPSAMRSTVIAKPRIEEIIPNIATDSFGILLGESIGSCCSLSTHRGGKMKANGMAASTPYKNERHQVVST